MHNSNNVTVPAGQESSNTIRRANHELGLYDLPSFYSAGEFIHPHEMPIEAAMSETDLNRSGRTTPFVTDGQREKVYRHGRTDSTVGNGQLYRNKCISFLALIAGLAAFGCSLAALAGTTNWVDTWEPIDLPPSQEWPSLFGTGYGSLMPSRSGFGSGSGLSNSGKDKSSISSGSKSTSASSSTSSGKLSGSGTLGFGNGVEHQTGKSQSAEERGGHQSRTENVTTTTTLSSVGSWPAGALGTTTQIPAGSAGSTGSSRVTGADEEVDQEDELDYDDDDSYYAQDQESMAGQQDVADQRLVQLDHEDDQEQQDEEPRRSLVVVFHVGLFRACAVLKGELPASVVLPNLPCAALEYISWRPLSGQSFRLWRNVEFTPDFLNKLRYCTPCFLLGTFIGLVAIIVAIGGRCAGPDRSLVCSSLHILAGLSLGSGLIIFVSVLHEEFAVPSSLRSSRHSAGWPSVSSRLFNSGAHHENAAVSGSSVAFYSDSRTLTGTTTGYHSTPSSGSSGLVSAALIPSFRYGWSFYAALAAFVSSELAAAVYIILHTHVFKWASRTRSAAQAAVTSSSTTKPSLDASRCGSFKEIGVQTSPLSSASLLMMMDKRTTSLPTSADINQQQQQVPYCDLLAMDPGRAIQRDCDPEAPPFPSTGGSVSSNNSSCRPSPMYINAGSSTETDCTCQIHYATYRPKMRNAAHVAGIHRASTMPRKVAFAGDLASVYQQTPL